MPVADGTYALPLLGEHQLENAALALAAAEMAANEVGLGHEDLRQGLADVRWPARLEVLGRRPLVVVDGAHNVDSMSKMVSALSRHFQYDRLRLVFGASDDKPIRGMLRVAGQSATLYACSSGQTRAVPAAEVLACGREAGMAGRAYPRVSDALWQALDQARPEDCICVAGSLFVAAAAREAWARRFGVVRESYGEVEVVSLGDTWRM